VGGRAVGTAPGARGRAGPSLSRCSSGGTTLGALAAKNATRTIPIVMYAVGDPVGSGLVATLARPGGNLTGLSLFN
jgi:ABC transporter substrate binding protein